MSEPTSSVNTWDLLQGLGFAADSTVWSDVMPGLSLDFGNLKLSASCVMSARFVDIVLLTGAFYTSRSGCLICDEMPRGLESREQGLAWLAWCLDNAADGKFEPKREPEWLAEGRLYLHLLPWERQRAAYAERPHCYVQREWTRVALRSLAELVTIAGSDETVVFEFDGEVLKIRCAGKVIAMPASGKKWPQTFSIAARSIAQLPKRLMRDPVEFSVWENSIIIGRNRFADVANANAPTIRPSDEADKTLDDAFEGLLVKQPELPNAETDDDSCRSLDRKSSQHDGPDAF